jgi:ubiquinone/menaquinone biosynthesis C-methylase UbiE
VRLRQSGVTFDLCIVMIDYDRIAAEYAQHRQIHPVVLERLLGGLQPTAEVLEVGCGSGNYIVTIRDLVGCSCWGIDPSKEMLSRAAARSDQVHFLRGSGEALDLPCNCFDLVFSVDVIHHVSDRRQFFREAWGVMRQGGKVCTVTDSEWVIWHRQPLSEYFPETVAADLARYPPIGELREAMQEAGFAEIAEETVESRYWVSDIGPYRTKSFSCLQLVPEAAFRRGIERMEQDLLAGPILCVPRYVLIWGTRQRAADDRNRPGSVGIGV